MSVLPFQRLLIANRGEIACRIERTAKRMGLHTIAVFSDADRNAQHVALADEAIRIGPATAKDSYLRIESIIEAAHATRAEAVHPGYGFLSESAEFAAACARGGLVFVGPAAETIRRMGSKTEAKALVEKSGVPVVPGSQGQRQDEGTLAEAAARIGYPVLIKASAGGGGRGMRLVSSAHEFADALASAKREALAAFGDDEILLEKFIEKPRHIEVQILGDTFGNIVSLFERECTLQRRHQKVVEEAPSIVITPEQRVQISAAARAAAHAVAYCNAGTVEFVADASGFYFIEMNTRLQVEHPVTEMILGLDLIELQLRIAAGEKLPFSQDEIKANGHAIEVRIYAEDARKGFLPSTGVIRTWREPTGAGIRVDGGFRAGDPVLPYYDALLAKLIVLGEDRPGALTRMVDALDQFEIEGVGTNLPFLRALLQHPQVIRGEMDTAFIERELPNLVNPQHPLTALELAGGVAAIVLREREQHAQTKRPSPWDRTDGWMLAGPRTRTFNFASGAQRLSAVLRYGRHGMHVETAGQAQPIEFSSREAGKLDVALGDLRETYGATFAGRDVELTTQRGRLKLHWVDPFAAELRAVAEEGRITAPMPGTVIRILAEPGAQLSAGAPVLVLEAMKMEHTLRAPGQGRLVAFKCAAGDFVEEGAELAEFEPRGAEQAGQ
jgi:3-methylcrotonyl-CoA carboxylase alpha subunit